MTKKLVRKIIHIDEEKCNGCGACAIKCAEGALKIIDGKARLISETYCDGLGACLGECPQGAITIEERPAAEFSEEAVAQHLKTVEKTIPCGCSSAVVQEFEHNEPAATPTRGAVKSSLGHWPVQLTLIPPQAPFLKNADIVLVADCVPFAYPSIHEDFLAGHAVLVACPKLDDFVAHQEKLTQILAIAKPKSLTVVHMEVPCCSGLVYMAKQALATSGANIPLREVTIGVKGDIKTEGS
jgi:NAD-dependent dihydropyrimidine dehydrogenase PreA subunit